MNTLRADLVSAQAKPLEISPSQATSTLRFYGDEFVFDIVSGMFYRMNRTACFILRALDVGANPRDLPKMLQSRYGLDRATATRDVELFLNDLASLEPLNRLHPANQARS